MADEDETKSVHKLDHLIDASLMRPVKTSPDAAKWYQSPLLVRWMSDNISVELQRRITIQTSKELIFADECIAMMKKIFRESSSTSMLNLEARWHDALTRVLRLSRSLCDGRHGCLYRMHELKMFIPEWMQINHSHFEPI